MNRRLLLSARDPGTAGHLIPLLRHIRTQGLWEISIAAQGAAARTLREAGEELIPFPEEVADAELADPLRLEALRAAARQMLDAVQPAAVVTGVSSPGAGVDEALLAAAACPTAAIQDYWGDANLRLGTPAGCYWVIDESAAMLTRERWGVPARVLGSLKHDAYRGLDARQLAAQARQRLGVEEAETLAGIFTQSSAIPGHDAAIHEAIATLGRLGRKVVLALREHPKYPLEFDAAAAAGRAGLRLLSVHDAALTEELLAACDLVLTPYSSCATDHAFLTAHARWARGAPVYLLNQPELQRAFSEQSGLETPPLARQGIGTVARSGRELAATLAKALDPSNTTAYVAACQRLPGPGAAERAITFLREMADA